MSSRLDLGKSICGTGRDPHSCTTLVNAPAFLIIIDTIADMTVSYFGGCSGIERFLIAWMLPSFVSNLNIHRFHYHMSSTHRTSSIQYYTSLIRYHTSSKQRQQMQQRMQQRTTQQQIRRPSFCAILLFFEPRVP